MSTLSDVYGDSYRAAPGVLSVIFEQEGYHFYDMRDISVIQASNKDLYDSRHMTEKGTIKMLIYLSNKEKKLMEYITTSRLQELLTSEAF